MIPSPHVWQRVVSNVQSSEHLTSPLCRPTTVSHVAVLGTITSHCSFPSRTPLRHLEQFVRSQRHWEVQRNSPSARPITEAQVCPARSFPSHCSFPSRIPSPQRPHLDTSNVHVSEQRSSPPEYPSVMQVISATSEPSHSSPSSRISLPHDTEDVPRPSASRTQAPKMIPISGSDNRKAMVRATDLLRNDTTAHLIILLGRMHNDSMG